MTIRLSTALRASLMTHSGLQTLMQYGVIDIYTGAQPSTADAAPTGVRVASITRDGLPFSHGITSAGLFVASVEPGVLTKSGRWVVKGRAEGLAGWWRWKWNKYDDNTNTDTIPRIDGAVGVDLVLANPNITAATEFDIDRFRFAFFQ